MTDDRRFERNLPERLLELAPPAMPDYRIDIVLATARTRQRPAWAFPERWLPMEIAVAPVRRRVRPPALTLVVLLIALLLAGSVALYLGAQPRRVAPPFGPAGNGAVYFTADNRDILAIPSIGARPRPIVTGPDVDGAPTPSKDGQRLLFVRQVYGGERLLVADPDGSHAKPLSGTYLGVAELDWSPDGSHVAVVSDVDGLPALSILTADGSSARTLALGLEPGQIWYLPDGRIVFVGKSHDSSGVAYWGPYVVEPDGSGLRAIAPASNDGDWLGINPSPDGRSLVYERYRTDTGELGRLYLLDIATGQSRLVNVAGVGPADGSAELGSPQFSPDGSEILFPRYTDNVRFALAPVAGGAGREIGPTDPGDDGVTAGFSPDGRSVLAWYPNLSQLWLLDVDGVKPDQQIDVTVSGAPTWQRVAP